METTDIKGGAPTSEEILQNVFKQLQAVVGKTDVKERNANTLADAVKVTKCPTGLVGCNSALLSEATGGILNCPPLDKAPDPLIVDPFGVCYAPESLREEWKDKHVSIDDLINEYSKELLLNLQNSNSLRRAMEEAATGATNRVAVNNIFTSSSTVAAAAVRAGVSTSQASAFLSVFSDKISTDAGRMLTSFVRRGAEFEVLYSLYVAMLFSRTSKAIVLRSYNTIGSMYTPETSSGGAATIQYLPTRFLNAIGNFWVFSLKMIILSAFSKVNDGYFVAVAAAKNSFQMLELARRDLAQARRTPIAGGEVTDVAGGDVAGGDVAGGVITLVSKTTDIAELQKRVMGASKAFQFKQVELAEALNVAFSEESMVSATQAIEQMSKLAPSLTDVPVLGSKLMKALETLYQDKKALSDFTSMGVSLGASFRVPSAPRGLSSSALAQLRGIEGDAARRNAARAASAAAAREVIDLSADDFVAPGLPYEPMSSGRSAAELEARRRTASRLLNRVRSAEGVAADFGDAYDEERMRSMRAQQRVQEIGEAYTAERANYLQERGRVATLQRALEANQRGTGVVSGLAQGFVDVVSAVGLGGGNVEGGDDYMSDNEFYGGEDMSPEMRAFLEGGEELKGGAIAPAHTSPEAIRKAVGYTPPETADEKKVREQLAAKGYPVTVFDVHSCPTSVNKTGNTYGTGNKWVETKNPWALCQAQMGYQFKTPRGFCYPEGMSCYDPENIVGARKALERNLDKAAIWQTLASTLNAIKRTEFDAWAAKKRAEIRADPANYEISDKEVEEIVQLHMPVKYKNLPNAMAVQTMVTVSAELANAINELNPQNDDAERKMLAEILESSGTFEASWRDANPVVQSENIDRIASGLVASASNCSEVSIKQHEEVPLNIRGTAGCNVLDIGGEKSHVPSDVYNRIDMEKIQKGEAADPLVLWWRKYDHAKKAEHAKKISKLRAALDPHNDIHSPQKQTILAMAQKALGPAGREALKSHL
jgi:hypothetical protein